MVLMWSKTARQIKFRRVQMRLLYKLALWRTNECPLIRDFARRVSRSKALSQLTYAQLYVRIEASD